MAEKTKRWCRWMLVMLICIGGAAMASGCFWVHHDDDHHHDHPEDHHFDDHHDDGH